MNVLALDIGGANIKAAHGRVEHRGRPEHLRAMSRPFAVWREPHRLADQLRAVTDTMPPFDRLLVTMTAELCDCFESRREGVARVLDAVTELLRSPTVNAPAHVWTLDGAFASPRQVNMNPLIAASANWHALASWSARLHGRGTSLLIDVGSTTTDIVLLRSGQPICLASHDQSRLASGELVYTGAIRTPLMSLKLSTQPRLAAEWFATMADVYCLLGELDEHDGAVIASDGAAFHRYACANRILRMVGSDLGLPLEPLSKASLDTTRYGERHHQARELAEQFAAAQRRLISEAIADMLAEHSCRDSTQKVHLDRVVVSGCGEFVARSVAAQALPGVPVVALSERMGAPVSTAACACALLHLWEPA